MLPQNAALAARVRCAIYTRKSTEEGLDQACNSLQAQRDAAQAYIASQQAQGWELLPHLYDDGGYTGANMQRPALARCSTTLRPAAWTAWWCIRSTGSAARCSILLASWASSRNVDSASF